MNEQQIDAYAKLAPDEAPGVSPAAAMRNPPDHLQTVCAQPVQVQIRRAGDAEPLSRDRVTVFQSGKAHIPDGNAG